MKRSASTALSTRRSSSRRHMRSRCASICSGRGGVVTVPPRSIRPNHVKLRNHLKVTSVLGHESQSILKRRGGNQRIRNHQSVTKSELLDQIVSRARDIWVNWENPNRFEKAFGLAEFYFISAADDQLHCGDSTDLNVKSPTLVVEKSPRLKMPAS